MIQRFPILLAIIALLLVCGCGKGRPKTIHVNGHVTLNGGKWPGKGVVIFRTITAAPGYIERPGRAIFDADGNFSAGTYDAGDGLIPGEYNVLFQYSPQGGAGASAAELSKAIVANDKLNVPADSGTIEYKFDVKRK